MLSAIFKKKLTDEQLVNVFVNGILESIDNGFNDVISLIEEDPAFIRKPSLKGVSDGHFIMIVISGNIKALDTFFSPIQQQNIEPLIFKSFAEVFQMTEKEFISYYNSYSSFMSRVNHPSKVILYGMSKAMFHKYNLNDFQESYFKSMDTPNPLFLKRMDGIMKNFRWNWDAFFKRYKMD